MKLPQCIRLFGRILTALALVAALATAQWRALATEPSHPDLKAPYTELIKALNASEDGSAGPGTRLKAARELVIELTALGSTSADLDKDAEKLKEVVDKLSALKGAGDNKGLKAFRKELAAELKGAITSAWTTFNAAYEKLAQPDQEKDRQAHKTALNQKTMVVKALDDLLADADPGQEKGLPGILGDADERGTLKSGVVHLAVYASKVLSAGDTALTATGLKAAPTNGPILDVLETLQQGLPAFDSVDVKLVGLHKSGRGISKEVGFLKTRVKVKVNGKDEDEDAAAHINKRVESQEASVKTTAALLEKWFAAGVTAFDNELTEFNKLAVKVAGSGLNQSPGLNFIALIQEKRKLGEQVRAIDGSFQKLAARLTGEKRLQKEISDASVKLSDLRVSEQVYAAALSNLDDFMTGAANEFVEEQIRLYYFVDVPRLLQVLNPAARPQDTETDRVSEHANALRRQIAEADVDLAEALGLVNDTRRRLLSIRRDIKKAKSEAARAEKSADSASDLVENLTRRKSRLTEGGTPTPEEQREIDRLTRQLTKAEGEKTEKEAAKAKAIEERDRLLNEEEGLPAEEAAAVEAMEAAQHEVRRLRRELEIDVPVEAELFGQARDRSRFWAANANRFSTDPLKRCALYGHEDSRTIFVRGRPDDVRRVQEAVASFDVPTPQARLVLWTLQFNATDSDGTADFLSKVDGELNAVRTNTAIVQFTLRGALNAAVNKAAFQAEYKSKLTDELVEAAGLAPPAVERLKRYAFYSDEVRRSLQFRDDLLLRDPNCAAQTLAEMEYVTRWTLPDPLGTTTVGEMLFVLLLAPRSSRQAVIEDWQQRLAHIGATLMVAARVEGERDSAARRSRQAKESASFQNAADAHRQDTDRESADAAKAIADLRTHGLNLPSEPHQAELLARYLGSRTLHGFVIALLGAHPDDPRANGDYSVDGLQREVLLALQTRARQAVATEIRHLIRSLDSARTIGSEPRRQVDLYAQAIVLGSILRQEGLLHLATKPACDGDDSPDACPVLPSSAVGFSTVAGPRFGILGREGRSAIGAGDKMDPADCGKLPESIGDGEVRELRTLWLLAGDVGRANRLQQATPRVAAADDLIKTIIQRMEDDLESAFTRPALDEIRRLMRTSKADLRFVSLQRESVIASNRLIARIDARASADLQPGSQEQVLAAQQLAQLTQGFEKQQKASSGIGGLLAGGLAKGAGLGLLKAGGLGLAGMLLSGELSTDTKPVSNEVYGINSGHLFKVTPVLNPSGQVVRFRFDFAATTRLREPDGTTNPLVPRVERHVVNTEVELSNFELREISRFDTNSQLGRPTRRSGGVPVLRDIPIFKDVPLLGYFVKSKGSKPMTQHSLILASTTIYPTVGDLAGLMASAPPRFDLDGNPPDFITPVHPKLALEEAERKLAEAFSAVGASMPPNLDDVTEALEEAKEALEYARLTWTEHGQPGPADLGLSRAEATLSFLELAPSPLRNAVTELRKAILGLRQALLDWNALAQEERGVAFPGRSGSEAQRIQQFLR